MTELTIPSLSLFRNSPSKHKREIHQPAVNVDHSICDVLRESSTIGNYAYLPEYRPTVLPGPDLYVEQVKLARAQRELVYLDAYKNALQSGAASSYQSTRRQESLQSFGPKSKREPCYCESPPRAHPRPHAATYTQGFQQTNSGIIKNTNYLHTKPHPPPAPKD
jgi:hypothetical protein